jgi:4-amino-4-deoxy-L-arabinose transferase-like glycosyltransferase
VTLPYLPRAPTADGRNRLPLLLALIAAITLYRLFALAIGGLNLYVDEAQYWTWAQHLDWGYFSKPPVIAATIALTTSVCGDGEICVKSGALLLYPITTLLLWSIARRLFDARVAFWSALVFLTLPGITLSSAIISTDVPLFLFWALALRTYLAALDSNQWRWWLAAGCAAGLGLLTKYTMVIFAISVLLHLALTPALRPQLRQPKLYVAMALAALIFLPNIIWNAEHGWPTLQHTAQISGLENQSRAQFSLHWKSLGDFLVGQLAVFGPLLFIAWSATLLFVTRWWHDARYRLLACFALPFLGVICLQALLGRANANWAAMTYATATIFVVARLLESRWRALLVASLVLHIGLALVAYHYDGLTRLAGVELTRKSDFYKRVRGWDTFGAEVQQLRTQYPGATLLGDNRDVIAELMYYVQPHPLDTVKWNPSGVIDDHYALTTTMADKNGRDFLYISRDGALKPGMGERFERAEPLPDIHIGIRKDWSLDFHVWLLRGFRGYQ